MLDFKTGEQDFLLRVEGDLDLVLAVPGEVRVGDPTGVELDDEDPLFLVIFIVAGNRDLNWLKKHL